MTVLRNNKDSLMAVLEAFVYDPLLNWRLIETGNKSKKAKSNTGNAGAPSASGDNVGGVSASEVSQSNADLNPLTGGDQMGKLRYSYPNLDLFFQKKKIFSAPIDSRPSEPENTLVGSGNMPQQQPEALNKKALDIVQRVRDKLTGKDFDPNACLEVSEQVDLLIRQATNNENLCQCYIGWCPFW